jgi:hypothetical protein
MLNKKSDAVNKEMKEQLAFVGQLCFATIVEAFTRNAKKLEIRRIVNHGVSLNVRIFHSGVIIPRDILTQSSMGELELYIATRPQPQPKTKVTRCSECGAIPSAFK